MTRSSSSTTSSPSSTPSAARQLAELVAGAEQVLVTAAVAADVPESLQGMRFLVADGEVVRDA